MDKVERDDGTKPYEPNCQFCKGNSASRWPDGRLMTSQEWCQQMDVCAATIDWDKVYGH